MTREEIERELLAVSARIAPQIAKMTNPDEISELMRREFDAALDRVKTELLGSSADAS